MLGNYILAASVTINILIGAVVASQSIKDNRNRIFVAAALAFSVLSLANTLSLDTELDQFFFIKTVMFSTTLSVYLLYLLIQSIQSEELLKKKFVKFITGFTIVVAVIDWTPLLFTGYKVASPPEPIPGIAFPIFLIHFVFVILATIISLRKGRKEATHKQRQQYRYILIGLIPILFLAPITSIVLPQVFGISSLIIVSPLYSTFFVLCVGYAIMRHGLFDIRFAAVRSVAYGLSIIVLALIYYFFAYVISLAFFQGEVTSTVSVSPLNIALALALAFIFQPIKRFFDRITDDIFFRDRYSATDFYKRLSSLLGSTTDLRGMLQRAATEIGDTLKAEQALFYVWQDDDHKVSAGTKQHRQLPPDDVRLLRTADPTGIVDGAIVAELLPEGDRVRRMLMSHHFAVALPLRQGNQTIGYLLLGPHQGVANYTTRDTRVLATIADELTIAIRNALSVQAVKDINTTLEQRIHAATKELRANNRQLRHLDVVKDEFLSMASHQLRTPLTSVKGYLSMVLDGDVGKISAAQRKVLGEAYISSERMVSLIHDFLNVSRIQTGKFMLETRPTDLGGVVKSELKALDRMATSRNIHLTAELSDVPTLDIDEGKLRQVIMNFVDNALYYSLPDTDVIVYLGVKNDAVELTVRDHGIGVPKAERKQLFEKFYRASNARERRPDGTGVGLYLAKQVVDAHGGTLIFVAHKDGSSFGFSLPIKELALQEESA